MVKPRQDKFKEISAKLPHSQTFETKDEKAVGERNVPLSVVDFSSQTAEARRK